MGSVTNAPQSSGDEEMPAVTVPEITQKEGLAVLDVALHYALIQPDMMPTDMLLLIQWCDFAAYNQGSILKQKKNKV